MIDMIILVFQVIPDIQPLRWLPLLPPHCPDTRHRHLAVLARHLHRPRPWERQQPAVHRPPLPADHLAPHPTHQHLHRITSRRIRWQRRRRRLRQ